MEKKVRILIILLLFIFVGTFIGMEKGVPEKNPLYRKVILIGIDGADPKVMGKLMKEGKLPNFSRLSQMGSFNPLATSISPQSPIAWSSIATGSNPGKHNVYDFIKRNPKNYLPQLSLTEEKRGMLSTSYEVPVKGKPFWEITSEANIPSTVIRWPMTFPAKELDGKMLAGLGVPDIKGLLNSYSYYTSLAQNEVGDGLEKNIRVDISGNEINTIIRGPRTKKGGNTIDITVPMQIIIPPDNEMAKLIIQGTEYEVKSNDWSDWIRIKFKINFLTEVKGIARFYLLSVKPFKMYMTSVQIDPENPIQPISYPGDYSKELSNEIGIFNTMGMPEDTNALNENRIPDEVFIEQVDMINDERIKMFWNEFNQFEEGVFAFIFDGSDRVQHMFWDDKLLEEDDQTLSINPYVEEHFIKKDNFIGGVLDKVDEDTAIFVFSDHGFSSFERSVSINTWLVENGYMTLNQEATKSNSGELFSFVDWSKTRAYSLGFTSIYINLKGREEKGVVSPNEKEELIEEIVAKLRNLKDEELGENAVINVYKSSEVYSGEYVDNAPDIIVGFAPGYRMGWQNAIGGVTPEIFSDNTKHWRGDHLVDHSIVPGVLFTNLKLNKVNPHQMDLAPTVLSILGVNIPDDMDGENLLYLNGLT